MAEKRKHQDPESSSNQIKRLNMEEICWIDVIPEEILDFVIGYLPTKDMLSLASTSKKFNELIGTSSKYMKRPVLQADKLLRQGKDKWTSGRMYQNLEIGNCGYFENCFLDGIAKLLKNIVKTVNWFSQDKLKMLEKFPNLESVDVGWIMKSGQLNADELNLPNLKSLTIREANDTLAVFSKLQLKSLKVWDIKTLWIDQFDPEAIKNRNYTRGIFKQLIMNQTDLKEFQIGENQDLFQNDLLSTVKFKLTHLDISVHQNFNPDMTKNFIAFINHHEDSLVKLKCISVPMMSYFSDFINLQTIELIFYVRGSNFGLNTKVKMVHVHKLSLTFTDKERNNNEIYVSIYKFIDKFEETFPCLKELFIEDVILPQRKQLFGSIGTLEKLTMKNCKFTLRTTVAEVDTMHFIKCCFVGANPIDYFSKIHCKKMLIDQCISIGWVEDFIELTNTALDSLEIVTTKDLSARFMKVLKNNEYKIKKLYLRH